MEFVSITLEGRSLRLVPLPDGRYLARHVEHAGQPTDKGAAVILVDELTQCAAFEELQVPGGFVSLRACDLRFLGVHTSGRVVAGRISNGTWERFRYLEVPTELWEAGTDEPGSLSTAASAEAAPVRAVAPAEPDPLQPR